MKWSNRVNLHCTVQTMQKSMSQLVNRKYDCSVSTALCLRRWLGWHGCACDVWAAVFQWFCPMLYTFSSWTWRGFLTQCHMAQLRCSCISCSSDKTSQDKKHRGKEKSTEGHWKMNVFIPYRTALCWVACCAPRQYSSHLYNYSRISVVLTLQTSWF